MISLAVLSIGLALPVVTASCEPTREKMLAQIERDFGEVPVAIGISPSGNHLFELTVDPNDQSWSLIASPPGGGLSCVVATGNNWQAIPAMKRTI